ncbi:YfbM family protein [Paenibacillus camerounensis]|uniref:YfbM family protein n=1 Tax=Paenibacillus camerounensis TaxID=1243663 RepID=UPI0005AAE001|nr:YfbM family protein [Paenibacillus camerounensis]
MGILACYLSLNDALADEVAQLDNSAIITKIEQLMENRLCPIYEMDKCWDGLHFLLTGVSASQPIEGDPLSEAVVGVHVLDTEDFIAVIGSDELPRIIASLQAVDRITLRKNFKLSAFRQQQIYPNTWVDEETDERFTELTLELQNLISFYEHSRDQGHDILIGIY